MKFVKRIISVACALAALIVPAGAQVAPSVQPDSITAAAASILGTALKGSIAEIESLGVDLNRQELMKMLMSIVDGATPPYSYERAYAIIDAGVMNRQQAYVDSVFSVEAQQAFVNKAASAEGAVTTPSGLVFQVIVEGEGVTPVSGDDVVLNYVGEFSDGSVFDSTDEPVKFDVDRLVPGFTEGLKMMKPGGKYRIVIPSSLGYGENGIPGSVPPNAALVFTVDLLRVVPKPTNSLQ